MVNKWKRRPVASRESRVALAFCAARIRAESRLKSSASRFAYVIAAVLAMGCGYVHVLVRDPLLTALMVLVFTMVLGVWQPEHPWRWFVVFAVIVPAYTVVARLTVHPELNRGEIAGSFVAVFSGLAGGIGGSVLRRVFVTLFREG